MLYDYTVQQMEAMDAARKRGRTLAMDAKLPPYKRLGRDQEPDEQDRKYHREYAPDGRPFNRSPDSAKDGDAPAVLDIDACAKLLAFLHGKLEADDLAEVAQFLSEQKDTGAEGEDLAPGPGGVAGAGFPKTGAQDSRRRQTFDERFPELARIRNLGR